MSGLDPITGIAGAIEQATAFAETIANKIAPDKTKQAELQAELQKYALEVEVRALEAQTKINEKEAQHPNFFVAGSRPAAIWMCVGILTWNLGLAPLLTWFSFMFGGPAYPTVPDESLWIVLSGLLGVAGMRSADKAMGGGSTKFVQVRKATKA